MRSMVNCSHAPMPSRLATTVLPPPCWAKKSLPSADWKASPSPLINGPPLKSRTLKVSHGPQPLRFATTARPPINSAHTQWPSDACKAMRTEVWASKRIAATNASAANFNPIERENVFIVVFLLLLRLRLFRRQPVCPGLVNEQCGRTLALPIPPPFFGHRDAILQTRVSGNWPLQAPHLECMVYTVHIIVGEQGICCRLDQSADPRARLSSRDRHLLRLLTAAAGC